MKPIAFRKVPLWPLVLLLIGVAAGCGDRADLPRDSQTVGGIRIHLGVVPATRVPDHPIGQGDPGALHGGTPEGRGSHHVVVALFDARTGARIVDARVRAGVGDQSYNHAPDQELETMQVNEAMSYGAFFFMQTPGVYWIHLEILRRGAAIPVTAKFAYEQVPGE